MNQEIAGKAVESSALVIAINNSWELAPEADVLFAADSRWWNAYPKAAGFRGERIVCEANRVPYATFLTPKVLPSGSNSALQAAFWMADCGVERIALFGVDLRDDERTHWHGLHEGLNNPSENTFTRHRAAWREFANILDRPEVVNCSERSALTCFPKMSLEKALS